MNTAKTHKRIYVDVGYYHGVYICRLSFEKWKIDEDSIKVKWKRGVHHLLSCGIRGLVRDRPCIIYISLPTFSS